MITCDKCHGEYSALATNAVAHLHIKDWRCNHIEAYCSNCGAREIIFLGPNRLEEVIRSGKLQVSVLAEATSDLRVRAETAWAAADDPWAPPEKPERRAAEAEPHAGDVELAGETLTRYELSARHEKLITTFGETLSAIPDDLLWDGLSGDHRRDYPERWVD